MEPVISKAKPKDKVRKIQLKTVGRSIRELSEFGKKLIDGLGDDIFNFQTQQTLLYSILKQISPVSKSLERNDPSIERACETVLKHFGLHRDAKLSVMTDTGEREIKSPKKTSTEKFCEMIIGIEKIPAHAYELLLNDVNRDLHSISELITWYETQRCIQRYTKDNEIPKSHEDRIVYDFYKRCLSERNEILNYYLNGLKQRAIDKSRHRWGFLSLAFSVSEMFADRPYHYARPFSIHYFDCRQIDLAGHRLGEFTIEEGRAIQKLYEKNKTKFYRLYFKRISVQQHFQNFKFYLPNLPFSQDRNVIFDELIKLFKAKRWISFYALALPQVEGLFSEMCLAISPERDLSQKSLTHKVNSVRPFHFLSTSYFDYYQYHIPKQRNRFAHTGYDEDFKLKSYDLLVDLSHLLQVFYELDNPLVKIKKLHTRRNFEDFVTIKEVAHYFRLLNQLRPTQVKDIKSETEKFEKEFLSQDCSLDYTCYEMMQELPKVIVEFVESINNSFKFAHGAIQFEKMNKPQIQELLKVPEQWETLRYCFMLKDDVVEKLEAYYTVLSNYKKYLPSLREEVKSELQNLISANKDILRNIVETKTTLLSTLS